MMSVRSNCPRLAVFKRKYACRGKSTFTFLGTYTNDPPDQTALFNAANLLSSIGMTVPKYSRNRSGYFSNHLRWREDHALFFKMLLNRVIDHLRFICAQSGQELSFGGHTKPVKRALDIIRNVVPGFFAFLQWV